MAEPKLIEQLAGERAHGAVSLTLLWKGALEALPALPEDLLATVARALPSPDAGRQLAHYLAREADPAGAVRQLLREVDESHEPLEQWLHAFEVLALFLESTAHRPSLTQALGYLHCCAAVSGTGARYATFPMTVETMLETYGYSGMQD